MRPTFIEVLQANHIVMFDPKWQQIKTLVERNVDNIWTYVEKCGITSLAHQWILCSEWVPSEWESKQMIKTSQ